MSRYTVSQSVHAPPTQIWPHLSNIAGWAEVLDTVDKVEALDGSGLAEKHRFRLTQPGLRPTIWTVTNVTPQRGFSWVSRGPVMTMRADHRIKPLDGRRSELTLTFEFSGALGWLLGRLYGAKTRAFLMSEATRFACLAESR